MSSTGGGKDAMLLVRQRPVTGCVAQLGNLPPAGCVESKGLNTLDKENK